MFCCVPGPNASFDTYIVIHTYGVCQSTIPVIYVILWHKWHIWHLTFSMHIYFNMGVKRSGRASGMQPTILDILNNCIRQCAKLHPLWFLLGYFLLMFCCYLAKTKSSSALKTSCKIRYNFCCLLLWMKQQPHLIELVDQLSKSTQNVRRIVCYNALQSTYSKTPVHTFLHLNMYLLCCGSPSLNGQIRWKLFVSKLAMFGF